MFLMLWLTLRYRTLDPQRPDEESPIPAPIWIDSAGSAFMLPLNQRLPSTEPTYQPHLIPRDERYGSDKLRLVEEMYLDDMFSWTWLSMTACNTKAPLFGNCVLLRTHDLGFGHWLIIDTMDEQQVARFARQSQQESQRQSGRRGFLNRLRTLFRNDRSKRTSRLSFTSRPRQPSPLPAPQETTRPVEHQRELPPQQRMTNIQRPQSKTSTLLLIQDDADALFQWTEQYDDQTSAISPLSPSCPAVHEEEEEEEESLDEEAAATTTITTPASSTRTITPPPQPFPPTPNLTPEQPMTKSMTVQVAYEPFPLNWPLPPPSPVSLRIAPTTPTKNSPSDDEAIFPRPQSATVPSRRLLPSHFSTSTASLPLASSSSPESNPSATAIAEYQRWRRLRSRFDA